VKSNRIRAAFEAELKMLPLASLLPTKEVPKGFRVSPRWRSIACTIEEIGLVEPLVVYRKADLRGHYLLLDGHLRREILMEKGEVEAECLLAEDDEAFTYNKKINRLAVVQEHFLVLRAIERGISEERLAKVLGVKVDYVKRRRTLLRGICPEAVGLLSSKPVNPVVFDLLRKMKPARQVEACKLMSSTSTYSSSYAKALLSSSSDEDRTRPRRQAPSIVTSADLALMERETKIANENFKVVEMNYGKDLVNLVIASRYVSSLLGRPKIVRYLDENHPEMLREFRTIVSAISTAGSPESYANMDCDARLSSDAPLSIHTSAKEKPHRRRRSKATASRKSSATNYRQRANV
jgi:ParB-like chromosome segregation protein Spo0J